MTGVQTCALPDRKSTRLNSSHTIISHAVFCLKKKKEAPQPSRTATRGRWRARTSASAADAEGRAARLREPPLLAAGGRRRGICVFFNDTATTEIYTLSLHDALPISRTTRSAALPPTPATPRSMASAAWRSEEHTSELQSHDNHVCRLLLQQKRETKEGLGAEGGARAGRSVRGVLAGR